MIMNSGKIVAVTQPKDPNINAEQFIAYTARVSNPKGQKNHDTANKLLKYLLDNKHYSPFEMVHVVMEIHTTREISLQLARHWSFRFQQWSNRYSKINTNDLIIVKPRLQDTKNRQNSIPLLMDEVNDYSWFEEDQRKLNVLASEIYNNAIDKGIAKEVARKVLPEGLTPTTLYAANDLRSWIFYCQLRCKPETQLEHRELAQSCWKELKKEFKFLEYFDQVPEKKGLKLSLNVLKHMFLMYLAILVILILLQIPPYS